MINQLIKEFTSHAICFCIDIGCWVCISHVHLDLVLRDGYLLGTVILQI
jgi:hypothetical protein